jgi:sorbitol-specific phosphotransferase system component IIC
MRLLANLSIGRKLAIVPVTILLVLGVVAVTNLAGQARVQDLESRADDLDRVALLLRRLDTRNSD